MAKPEAGLHRRREHVEALAVLVPPARARSQAHRQIVLTPWQQAMTAAHPGQLARGLIHSDGWRGINVATNHGKRYEYPRYLFSNKNEDILGICTWALDLLGVAWKRNNANSISVARRDAVARLDEFVGPKH